MSAPAASRNRSWLPLLPQPPSRPRRTPLAHSMGRVVAARNASRPETGQVTVAAPHGGVSSAHTVLPGEVGRGSVPQRVASRATRSSPRPDSASPGSSRTDRGGTRSARVSVASTRRASGVVVSRRWKSRPGTLPCRTALAVSSAAIRVRASMTTESYPYPYWSSRCETRRRASRAPRGVEVNRMANSCLNQPSRKHVLFPQVRGAIPGPPPPHPLIEPITRLKAPETTNTGESHDSTGTP